MTLESQSSNGSFDDEAIRYDDAIVGDSELGILSSKALRALTKASRACLLYDFDNEAVADFLRELEFRMERVLSSGPLTLEVRPWELLRDGEVVYREQDREKSLSFRLYYDGVRSLTIQPEVTWEEITRLVGILSIRYTGIRQQEEDVVTLLWKAGLENIDVETVESYVPLDDESDNGAAARGSLRSELHETVREVHLPRPRLTDAVELAFHPVPSDRLETLRLEDDWAALAPQCLRLVELLMSYATVDDDPIDAELSLPLIRDVRDFLLAEQENERLLELVHVVQRAVEHVADPAARAEMLAVFTEREAFARMVDAAVTAEQVPQALVEVVSVAPKDELEVLLHVLASRWSGAGERIGREILAGALGDRIQQLADVVLAAPGSLAAELLGVAADRDPEFAVVLAIAMIQRNDRPSRLKALAVLEELPYRSEVGRVLVDHGITSRDLEVCAGAAAILAANAERRAFPAVARALEKRANAGDRPEKLAPLAESLARLDPSRTVSQFNAWIRPDKLLKRVRAAPSPLWHLAVHCLARVPGDGAAELLRWIHSRVENDLKMRCVQSMAQQKEL